MRDVAPFKRRWDIQREWERDPGNEFDTFFEEIYKSAIFKYVSNFQSLLKYYDVHS